MRVSAASPARLFSPLTCPVKALASELLSELLLPHTAWAVAPDCELVPSSQLADELPLVADSSQDAVLLDDVLPPRAEVTEDMDDMGDLDRAGSATRGGIVWRNWLNIDD